MQNVICNLTKADIRINKGSSITVQDAHKRAQVCAHTTMHHNTHTCACVHTHTHTYTDRVLTIFVTYIEYLDVRESNI